MTYTTIARIKDVILDILITKTKIGVTIRRQKEIVTIAKFNVMHSPTVVASSVEPNIAVGGKWENALF